MQTMVRWAIAATQGRSLLLDSRIIGSCVRFAATSRGGRFFAWIRFSQVKRGHDRWIGGVCDGIARRLGWNTTLVRALMVVATLFSARVPRSMAWRGLCCRMSATIRFLLRI